MGGLKGMKLYVPGDYSQTVVARMGTYKHFLKHASETVCNRCKHVVGEWRGKKYEITATTEPFSCKGFIGAGGKKIAGEMARNVSLKIKMTRLATS